MTIQTWRRKQNRLGRDVYRGPAVFAVTIVTWQRRQAFGDTELVTLHRGQLENAAKAHGFRLLAYCFMPDHLHLLVEGSDGSDLARFMKSFKQQSSFAYKRRCGQPLWQRSYHDHVLRSEAEIRPQIAYIMDNPVKAGFVEEVQAYPFLGGDLVREMLVAT